jgi:GT2 family glycosyltransferase
MNNFDPPPCISVILVTWNSAVHMPRCLDCLAAQTLKDFEVVLVDNGSTDGSLDGLESRWPGLTLRLERLDKNRGFAAANNVGARLARGHWLALLNTDAFPDPGWLEKLLWAAGHYPEFSCFSSRLLQARNPHFLDETGDLYHVSGLAWKRHLGYPANQYGLEAQEVFSPCAAAALYPRQAFLEAGGFNEDFFAYFEDIDLGFRLRLLGYRTLYIPQAVVHHIGSATFGALSDFAFYHAHRNLVWTFMQNMPARMLWKYLPAHILANFIYLAYYAMRGRGAIMWRAKVDALRGLPNVLRKRQATQHCRASTADLERVMEHGLLQPYLLGYHLRRVLRKWKKATGGE